MYICITCAETLLKVVGMKNLIYIFLFFALLTSCAKSPYGPENSENPFSSATSVTLIIRGSTIDADNRQAVRGIRLILETYSASDPAYKNTLVRDTVYSGSEGLYEFFLKNRTFDKRFKIISEDVDGQNNGGYYAKGLIEIAPISKYSPSYNAEDNTYLLNGNVFFLKK